MKKIFFVMMVLVLSFGFLLLRFGSALTQEGNPIPILISIVKLEWSGGDFQQFSATTNENKYVSAHEAHVNHTVIKEFMKE